MVSRTARQCGHRRIVFGAVNPSGKLPLSFPLSEFELPRPKPRTPLPGGGYFDVDYTEGLNLGYKWYDPNRIQPLFPFWLRAFLHYFCFLEFTHHARND